MSLEQLSTKTDNITAQKTGQHIPEELTLSSQENHIVSRQHLQQSLKAPYSLIKPSNVLALQRTIGNQATQLQLLNRKTRTQLSTPTDSTYKTIRRCACGGEIKEEGGECAACRAQRISRQYSTQILARTNLVPPGNCTPIEHRALQNNVNNACKKTRRCNPNDDCATLQQRIQDNADCIRARSTINSRCFRGGDAGHQEAIQGAVGALNNCWSIYNRQCQNQNSQRTAPATQQSRTPVVDQSFMDRMSQLTGLTGAALVAYLIISEGSRILFPPRNLVPVP